MTAHPYKTAPAKAFWARGVARGFDAAELVAGDPLLRPDDLVASAGSCFAANIVPYLEQAGFTYLRTRKSVALLPELDEDNFSYSKFSAGYGNLYTTRQLIQLLRRARGQWAPQEDRWHFDGTVIDPFRPGLKYAASSDAEFDLLQRQHLAETREMFERSSVFIFTLGLTEGWESVLDGAAFPACPGTIAGSFDPTRHRFVNYGVSEIVEDLTAFASEVRELNPGLRLLFTVSPVPLVATATDEHVVTATIYSKSVLRAAAGEAVAKIPDARYFPAYEIITGPQAPHSFFEDDRRNPSREGIDEVMRTLLASCGVAPGAPRQEPEAKAVASGPNDLARIIAEAECEEAASAL